MDTFTMPKPDELATLDRAELEAALAAVEQVRRRAEVLLAEGVGVAQARGDHRADRHRTVKAWGRASFGWSPADAHRIARNGAALAGLPAVRRAARSGSLGVAQLNEFGRVHANPRVREALKACQEPLVADAEQRWFVDFRDLLARWEALADADGAHREHTDAHHQRSATVGIVGSQVVVHAEGSSFEGIELREIFRRFCEAEFAADWEFAKFVADFEGGGEPCAADMPRTDEQRKFDALVAIFRAAASAPVDGKLPDPLVNLVVDVHTAEDLVRRAAGEQVADPPAEEYHERRCETIDGTPVDPEQMLWALLVGAVRRVVIDEAGVVIDLGRRSRLFRGGAREAVLLADRRCLWPGCGLPAGLCQIDHTDSWSDAHGSTNPHNGGPGCGCHNRHKSHGYTSRRDDLGVWHTWRPDGSEIGEHAGLRFDDLLIAAP